MKLLEGHKDRIEKIAYKKVTNTVLKRTAEDLFK